MLPLYHTVSHTVYMGLLWKNTNVYETFFMKKCIAAFGGGSQYLGAIGIKNVQNPWSIKQSFFWLKLNWKTGLCINITFLLDSLGWIPLH